MTNIHRVLVFVAVYALFGSIGGACAIGKSQSPPQPPVLAPSGPPSSYRVQFLHAPYEAHELWVCGHGSLLGSASYELSCVPYVVFAGALP